MQKFQQVFDTFFLSLSRAVHLILSLFLLIVKEYFKFSDVKENKTVHFLNSESVAIEKGYKRICQRWRWSRPWVKVQFFLFLFFVQIPLKNPNILNNECPHPQTASKNRSAARIVKIKSHSHSLLPIIIPNGIFINSFLCIFSSCSMAIKIVFLKNSLKLIAHFSLNGIRTKKRNFFFVALIWNSVCIEYQFWMSENHRLGIESIGCSM